MKLQAFHQRLNACSRGLGNLQLKSVANYGSLHSLVSVTLGAVHFFTSNSMARSVSVSRGQALESMMNNHQQNVNSFATLSTLDLVSSLASFLLQFRIFGFIKL